MGRLRRYRTAFGRYKRGKGFGIHSPFAFGFVLKVLRERNPYYAYSNLESLRKLVISHTRHHFRHPRIISLKNAKIIFRVANYFNPLNVLQVGTSYGVSTVSVLSVSGKSHIYLCEPNLADYPVTANVLAEYSTRISHFTDVEAGIAAYEAAMAISRKNSGVAGQDENVDWRKAPFVLVNNIADEREYAEVSAFLSSLLKAEAVVVMRNLARSERVRLLWSKFCAEATFGMSFSNDKLAVFVVNRKLPRQDFSIWF